MIKTEQRAGLGFRADGNLLILAVPAAEVDDYTNPDAELLNGPSAIDVTYDIAPGGFNHQPGNEELTKDRLTLPNAPTEEGKQTDTLEITYMWSPTIPEGVTHIDKTLVYGEEYAFFRRSGIDHNAPVEAGQVVSAFQGECGRKREQPAATGEESTKVVTIRSMLPVIDEAVVVAGTP